MYNTVSQRFTTVRLLARCKLAMGGLLTTAQLKKVHYARPPSSKVDRGHRYNGPKRAAVKGEPKRLRQGQ